MTKKRIRPKADPEQQKSDVVGSQNSQDDLTDAEKAVGVHILGKNDMQRHFGTTDARADQKAINKRNGRSKKQ